MADLEVYSNSQLVVTQVEGSFEAKDPRMIDYLKLVKQMMSKFKFSEDRIGMLIP